MAARKRQAKKTPKPFQITPVISITDRQHTKLVNHLMSRVEIGHEFMKTSVDKFSWIDREIAGFLRRDADDQKRERDNKAGKGVKPTDTVIGLIVSQLDEALTFLATVLAPEEGLYTAISTAEKQQTAKGFSTLMNKHGAKFSHFTEIMRGLLNGMKYNFGGWEVDWVEKYGNKVKNDRVGGPEVIPNEIIFSGNSHNAFDPYNFGYDPSVEPTKVAEEGEFYYTIALKREFAIEKNVQNKVYFNFEHVKKNTNVKKTYYEDKPDIRADEFNSDYKTSWFGILSMGQGKKITQGHEEVTITAWISPSMFGLASKKEFELWRFVILNGTTVVRGVRLNNAHGQLPVGITTPIDDQMFPQTKSYAELLVPYQRFASFQLNMHQRSSRKKLGGFTIFNQRLLPQLANEDADMMGGKFGFDTSDPDFDVRKAIWQSNDGPETAGTLQDIERMDALMQKILPTDLLKQVAGLERATQYQAAATVQGANRRNLKIARVIDQQALSPLRTMQMYNILEFQKSMTILDPDGNEVEINPEDFRETDLEFQVHSGLRGLDKLALILHIKDVLNSILQNQDAAATFDVPKIINYWTTLIGDNTDFTQFKVKNAFDSLTQEQKQAAFEIFQQTLQAQQNQNAQ